MEESASLVKALERPCIDNGWILQEVQMDFRDFVPLIFLVDARLDYAPRGDSLGDAPHLEVLEMLLADIPDKCGGSLH